MSSNKQIASIFKEAGIIEKYGSGIKRVRETMLAAGAREPLFEIVGNFFKVTMFPTGGGVSGGVSDLLEYIQSDPGKNASETKTKLKLPQRTVERWLRQLKDEGKIEFRGAPKTGGYFSKRGD